MKIFEIVPQLSSGGGERFTVDLCNELSSLEHEITLIVFHNVGNWAFYRSEISEKVKIVTMKKKMGLDINLIFKLYKLIKRAKPDIVHTHLRAITYIFFSALVYRKAKYYHTVHNAAEKEASTGISRIIRKFAFKNKKIIPVTISKDSYRSFIEFYGIDAAMIVNGRNIPSELKVGSDIKNEIKSYKKTSKTRVLIQLARMEEVKRHTMMARVVKRLVTEGFDITMLMIGRTNEIYVEKIEAMQCREIHILGEKHNPLEYLHEADAYCLCSTYEGMPISLIEALGVGIIPICTPVGGIVNTVVDNENGFLSADTSEESYYNAVKRFLSLDDEELAKMKRIAKASYTPYSMTECGTKYANLFAEGLASNQYREK